MSFLDGSSSASSVWFPYGCARWRGAGLKQGETPIVFSGIDTPYAVWAALATSGAAPIAYPPSLNPYSVQGIVADGSGRTVAAYSGAFRTLEAGDPTVTGGPGSDASVVLYNPVLYGQRVMWGGKADRNGVFYTAKQLAQRDGPTTGTIDLDILDSGFTIPLSTNTGGAGYIIASPIPSIGTPATGVTPAPSLFNNGVYRETFTVPAPQDAPGARFKFVVASNHSTITQASTSTPRWICVRPPTAEVIGLTQMVGMMDGRACNASSGPSAPFVTNGPFTFGTTMPVYDSYATTGGGGATWTNSPGMWCSQLSLADGVPEGQEGLVYPPGETPTQALFWIGYRVGPPYVPPATAAEVINGGWLEPGATIELEYTTPTLISVRVTGSFHGVQSNQNNYVATGGPGVVFLFGK